MPILPLLLLLAQPTPQPVINWEAPPPAKPNAESDFDKALAATYEAEPKPRSGSLGFPPQTEEEKRAAANQAAIARAEAARKEAAGAWPDADKPKMKCRETANGLVCGTTEAGMDQQEREQKARLEAMDQD